MTDQNFRNAPVPYLDKTNKLQKQPVYFVTFGLVTGPLGTNSQVIPDEYSTGPIKAATKSRKILMANPTSVPSNVNPVTSESSFSSTTFRLLDKGGEITRLVGNYTMKNRLVTIYAGYRDIDESDFIPICSGQISNWSMSTDGTFYSFNVIDALKQLKQTILTGKTTLTEKFIPFYQIVRKPSGGNRNVYHVGNTVIYFNDITGIVDGATYTLLDKDGVVIENVDILSHDNATSSVTLTSGLVNEIDLQTNTYLFKRYAVSGGANVLKVTSTENFADQTNLSDGLGDRNYLRVGDCLYSYTGKTADTFTGVAAVTLEGNGAPDTDQDLGSDVENYILYEGNPADLLLRIILSTGNGTNSSYDVYPASQGVGIPQELVNIAGFEAKRDKFISWMQFKQFWIAEIESYKFLRTNILRQIVGSFFINKSGQIDLNLYFVPLPTIDTVILDDSNIIGTPTFDANLPTGQNFYNSIVAQWDYQPVQENYDTHQLTDFLTSEEKYEERSPLVIDCKFIRSDLDGLKIVDRMSDLYGGRYSTPPPVVNVDTFYTMHLTNISSIAFLNHTKIPNLRTGERGGSAVICEVIGLNPDYERGKVSMKLLGTGFASNKKYGAISPANWPDFLSADEGQKRYAFIGNQPGALFTQVQMSDGTDGYYITP